MPDDGFRRRTNWKHLLSADVRWSSWRSADRVAVLGPQECGNRVPLEQPPHTSQCVSRADDSAQCSMLYILLSLERRSVEPVTPRTSSLECAVKVLIVISLLSSAVAQSPAQGDQRPRFEDYPVTEQWRGSPVPVKLTTASERQFRTRLTDASKQPPNFAGHFRFTFWGCGSNCGAGAVIDLQTGVVYPPPLGAHGNGWDRWIISPAFFEDSGVDFRPNSRLVIVRCGIKNSGARRQTCRMFTTSFGRGIGFGSCSTSRERSGGEDRESHQEVASHSTAPDVDLEYDAEAAGRDRNLRAWTFIALLIIGVFIRAPWVAVVVFLLLVCGAVIAFIVGRTRREGSYLKLTGPADSKLVPRNGS